MFTNNNDFELNNITNQQLGKTELFHREFASVLNIFLENSSNMPILIQGPRGSGKKTIARQLGEYIEQKPKIYNFGNTTINNSPYIDIGTLIAEFSKSKARGDLIIIEDLDKMQVYDYIILLRLVKNEYPQDKSNCNFRIIILEDSNFSSIKNLSDIIKNECISIKIDKDPTIELISQKKIVDDKVKEKVKKA